MKQRNLVLAALASLVAISAGNAVAAEMEAPEMRVWSAVLSESGEETPGVTLNIVASQSASGSNSMVVESVEIVSTEVTEDEEGNMTETMSSLSCAGPFMVEGGGFMVEATAPMEEDAEMAEAKEEMEEGEEMAEAKEEMEEGEEMAEAKEEMEEGEEMAEAGEMEDEGCAFAVSGTVKNTYRAWHSWDMSGSVTVGQASVDFSIADSAPAMILEPEPEPEPEMEEEMSEEGEEAS